MNSLENMGTANPKRNGSSALKRLKSTLKDKRLVGPKLRSQKVNLRDGNFHTALPGTPHFSVSRRWFVFAHW